MRLRIGDLYRDFPRPPARCRFLPGSVMAGPRCGWVPGNGTAARAVRSWACRAAATSRGLAALMVVEEVAKPL